jgi:uncharacterized membrane protein YhaH (DUF805 family)
MRAFRRGGWWLIVAAVICVGGGVLSLSAALVGIGTAHPVPLGPLLIFVVAISVMSMAAGIGLLRLRDWARYAAAGLSCFSLFLYATSVVPALLRGEWSPADWAGLLAGLFVLFAVVRRWPGHRVRSGPV